jgi:hypothetical protein
MYRQSSEAMLLCITEEKKQTLRQAQNDTIKNVAAHVYGRQL